MNLLGHTSPFIINTGTKSHSLLASEAGSNNDRHQLPQCHQCSAPTKCHINHYLFAHLTCHTLSTMLPSVPSTPPPMTFSFTPSQAGVAGHTANLVPMCNGSTLSFFLLSSHNLLSFQLTYSTAPSRASSGLSDFNKEDISSFPFLHLPGQIHLAGLLSERQATNSLDSL